ncbi:MORC family CW-type zinc finger protein 3 isoform X2 [Phacochoerus africanus]|nr:MORC family CW-type zinc finger protein 3 isoform X2 [Phacochoerus africanus]XP_047652172.1 MORC family CW-type zinc finger protein 3 isoform X2 [Phacochoerus africanus]XP_047652177.1 MORC family CW-type zinc finger protein 3 isoform X2 [Phacochoerus africanus]
MTSDKLHKMLSFGFSDKVTMNGHVPVGLYGNGFKSGSMRLGKDAIVFTKNGESMSVGFLSQTYLEVIKAEHVVVPIVAFSKDRQIINSTESKASLAAILEHSLFSTEQKLLAELDAIMSTKGTRIIIWNLRSYKSATEFDFDKDKYDIRIPEDLDDTAGKKGYKKQERMDQIAPESDYSLRAYCSILYLKPRMQIILRGQKVKTQLVSKSLAYIERDIYRPKFLTNRTVRITFGFNCRNKDHYGIMMYHNNRLIKAYEKVGCQLRANNMGVGVVGIIDCYFLKPTHNKQDFDYTNEYRLTVTALGDKLNDYWNEMKVKKNAEYPLNLPVEEIEKRPDQNWVQCDSCLKWRKLPDGIDQLPEKWYCSNNPDPQFRNCDVPEEPEDEDLVHPTYEKTYKKKDKEKSRTKLSETIPRIPTELFFPTTPVSSQSFSPVKESVPRGHLSEAANTYTMRLINNHRGSPQSEPESNSLKRRLSTRSSILNAKNRRLNNQVFENSPYKDDDEDVIILEENSTPKPAVDDDIEVKLQQSHMEQSGVQVEPVGDNEPCGQTSSAGTSSSRCDQGTTAATQTEVPSLVVKKEETVEDEIDVRNDTAMLPSCVEAEGKTHETQETFDKSAGDAGCQFNELRNELLLVTQEKENYKRQCHMFTEQIKVLQQRILEMNDKCVKKEICHQSTETDAVFLLESVNGKSESPDHIVSQYQQALEEIERLKKQCSALKHVKAECSQCSSGESRSEMDEMVVQLDDVFRQLDKCSIERDQYKSEVELLEMEKSQIRSQCEELKNEIERLKSTSQQIGADVSTSSNIEESVNYTDGESLKLRSLRVNVGQLLAMIVPDLDLQQVNYDVDVVDEILGQVVEQMSEISST